MEAFGNIRPDERSVAIVEWFRKGDGSSYIRLDDTSRTHCIVNSAQASDFESAAEAQGWQFKLVGYDDFTDRHFYHITHLPPTELASIDPTTTMGAKALGGVIRKRKKKRVDVDGVLPAVERLLKLSSEITIGQMKAQAGDDATDEQKHRVERLRDRGADRAVHIVKATLAAESLNQTDDHFDEKNERLDAGLSTENVGLGKTYQIDTETHDKV